MSSKKRNFVLLVSLLLAIGAFVVLLRRFPVAHTTVALIKITDRNSNALFLDLRRSQTTEEFQRFRSTQLKLLKSPFVLQSALVRPNIAQLEAVVVKESEPVQWLQDDLQVSFPEGGEAIELRYEGAEDPEEMKKIVDAIIDAYKNEVLTKEMIRAGDYHLRVAALYSDLSKELAEKLEQYYTLAEELGFQEANTLVNIHIATDIEIDKGTASLQDLLHATDVGNADAITKLLASLPKNSSQSAGPALAKRVPNGALYLLSDEINQLRKIYHELGIHVRKLQLQDHTSTDIFRVLQPSNSTEYTRSTMQSCGIAALGGIATFTISSLTLLLLFALVVKLTAVNSKGS